MMTMLLVFTTSVATSNAASKDAETIFHKENQIIRGENFTNLNKYLDELNQLEEGTIVIRFLYEGDGIMSLFSLSNNDMSNGHFHMYITPSTIGMENRYEEPGEQSKDIHVKTNTTVKENQVHTLAMNVSTEDGYQFYLDGEEVLQDDTSDIAFLNNIYQPNTAELGRTDRAGNQNKYAFNGVIDFAEVYDQPLDDQALMNITKVTESTPETNPLPDDALITESESVFYSGLYDSNAYRIPALLHTQDDTLIAGIDKRIDHAGDSPADIDMLIRKSMDQGDSWEEDGVLINEYPGEASNIDQSLLQDQDTGRIFSLVVGFPEEGGFPTVERGNGYTTINGEDYIELKDDDGQSYTIREEGIVYDSNHEQTDYKVDEKRNLYEAGEKISNIFLNDAPLKPLKTSYLELWHSDDEGENWEGPMDLNDVVKEDWMPFLGDGPGSGIQIENGPNEGRLVYPIYFTNENNAQASAVIFSDDQGETWERGESPNEGRIVDGEVLDEKTFSGSQNEITESQVVEMPDGQLKLFMRNYSGHAQIATSFDGGETWDEEVVTEEALIAPYSQMSAIKYDGQIEGKDAVIFSSAGDSNERINGTVHAGLIEEVGEHDNGFKKYDFDWKYDQIVKEGAYGYSSLTNLKDGNIGLMYENGTDMDFIKFNPAYLKWEKEGELPTPALSSIDVLEDDQSFISGDTIQVKAEFDDYVMLSGNRSLKGNIAGETFTLSLADANKEGTTFTFEGELPTLEPKEHELTIQYADDLSVQNVFGEPLDTTNESNILTKNITIKSNQTVSEVKELVDTLADEGAFENDQIVHHLQLHLTSVSHYEKQENAEKIVKHMNGFKELLDNQKKNELISEDAYESLIDVSDTIIDNWK